MGIEDKKYEQAKSKFRNLLQEVKDFLDEDSSDVKTQGQARITETSPKGETLAKGRSFRDDAIEDAKQQEYWDSKREERSRQLIRQLRASQQEWKFRCKDEGGF